MSPIQQMLLGVGAVATKTYVDDIFSTYLYDGNSTTLSVNSGVDNTNGGMIWFKARSESERHLLFDTERGTSNYIESNSNAAQTSGGAALTSFDNDGYTLGASSYQNNSGRTYTSWNFRKVPGFFDVVTYTGNGSSNHQISHNLGSVPGCIMVKCTSETQDWMVYHVGTTDAAGPGGAYLRLNTNAAQYGSSGGFYNTTATSTAFTLGDANIGNKNNASYVAYIFAGGESTAATARSVDFDGTGDKLSLSSHADLQIGSSTYTMEFWVYKNVDTPDDYDVWAAKGSNANNTREFAIESMDDQTMDWYYATSGGTWSVVENVSAGKISTGQWVHICAQKDSNGYFSFFVNGTRTYYSTTGGATLNTDSDPFCIGGYADANPALESNVKISNFRFIKGTALYSSSFKPSTEPLTNVTNTKLLCCNDSSITGSTVTPSTISSVGSPTASTNSPFDDPSGYVFGDAEDQNVIKTGSYVGNGSSTAGPEINLGFEPQWILLKCSSASENWRIYDSMRGIVTGGTEPYLRTDREWAETSGQEGIEVTSTGFKLVSTDGALNGDGRDYIYCCIRRPDGYVGKPVELGTGAFAMAVANGSTPSFISNFPVDFALMRPPATSSDWSSSARLTQTDLQTNNANGEDTSLFDVFKFDHNNGWAVNRSSPRQSWMWKRHAGFDVVTYSGKGGSKTHRHNLNAVPEMIWVKCRADTGKDWWVYHKGLNGGTNPENYYIKLSSGDPEADQDEAWNDTAPTATSFTVGSNSAVNSYGDDYIAMLFASVNGISKVGYYNGTGSSGLSITTGFQPRFIVIKPAYRLDTYGGAWHMFDTLRGINSGAEYPLRLNTDEPQTVSNHLDYIDLDSDGFTIVSTHQNYNYSGARYIYYAHA